MPEYIFLMHDDGPAGEQDWQPYLRKLQQSRTFHSGLATVRQLEFALFDLRLHRDHDPSVAQDQRVAGIYRMLAAVRDEVSVLKPPAHI